MTPTTVHSLPVSKCEGNMANDDEGVSKGGNYKGQRAAPMLQ